MNNLILLVLANDSTLAKQINNDKFKNGFKRGKRCGSSFTSRILFVDFWWYIEIRILEN